MHKLLVWWMNPLQWLHDLASVVSRPLENEALENIKRRTARKHLDRLTAIADYDSHLAWNERILTGTERIARVADKFDMTVPEVVDALDEYERLFV